KTWRQLAQSRMLYADQLMKYFMLPITITFDISIISFFSLGKNKFPPTYSSFPNVEILVFLKFKVPPTLFKFPKFSMGELFKIKFPLTSSKDSRLVKFVKGGSNCLT